MEQLTLIPEPRRCSSCHVTKELQAFAFRNMVTGSRNSICRACHAEQRRSHYVRNKAVYIRREMARMKLKRQRNVTGVREYFRSHPCIDCGETDHVVLEFDHRDPASKIMNIGAMVGHRSWAAILTEIQKCDVRCANCHRRRTALQRGWRRLAAQQARGAADLLGSGG